MGGGLNITKENRDRMEILVSNIGLALVCFVSPGNVFMLESTTKFLHVCADSVQLERSKEKIPFINWFVWIKRYLIY